MINYPWRCEPLPAFELVGFTGIVTSGGEQYDAVRRDGRWETLRRLGGADPTIYGVASMDKECTDGRYRYTLAVKASPASVDTKGEEGLFNLSMPKAEWVIFTLDSFVGQYGKFWQDDPYKLLQALGREFDPAVGVHIDVYSPGYGSDEDKMEFMMPVRPSVAE